MSVRLIPELTDEQRMFADAVVRVMESGCPLSAVREHAERGEPGDPALRRKLADLGCFGLLVAEERGGGSLSGNGVADAAIVAAERGARLQPGPFVGTAVAAYTLGEAGTERAHHMALDALVAGASAATWAADGVLGSARPGLTVHETADGFVLSGTVRAVQDADECDTLLVTTRTGDTVRHFLLDRTADGLPGLSATRTESLDVTRRFHDLRFDAVRVPAAARLGSPAGRGATAGLLDRQIALAAVLSAAESVGAMDADFALAVDYAKTRIAFGRPIGSFQGLKHTLANTGLMLEMCKGLVAGAAGALGSGAPDGAAMAQMARAFVSERAVELAHNCFQVFGGIGYTWEHDQHLFLRRLAAEAHQFGAPAWFRARLWGQAVSGGHTTERTADV
ncbi:acyl-CoA/acyl-ACP dehydrogenase [Yinghuangia sp. ASG 101]|uniref:acyl-CoA dehydrogenase family protein n=1 Tax=Yinghuangia sp. ASG 101 TaxID=2896848 RepID=UPI001E5CE78B|nr:acyl-CoA dehydrogenase family protein [Yinghuangia sp. ASG 101]UGQ11921.1 acyl-CoA/acyl-ACP dehydrogenase [Yinghuangia sp. ASG 101]